MSYTILSFNMRNVGGGALMNRDWSTVADIMRDTRADIVAVQEVFSETPLKLQLCQRLNAGFLCDWRYRCVSRQTCRNMRGEGYAFLWNARRVALSPIEKIIGGNRVVVGTHEPEIRTEWSRSLVRPPCVARFIPVGWCVPFIELRVISTHIIFGEDKYSREKGNELSDKEMRLAEYRALSERLFPRVCKDRSDGNFRTPYTFIAGDYNLLQGECSVIDSLPKEEVAFMKTRQILASTITQGDDSNQGHYTDHDYDHFSYSNREHQYIHGVERVDAPAKYYSGDFKKYGESMSDHVPVTMLFDVGTTNPEHVASGVSTMEEQR